MEVGNAVTSLTHLVWTRLPAHVVPANIHTRVLQSSLDQIQLREVATRGMPYWVRLMGVGNDTEVVGPVQSETVVALAADVAAPFVRRAHPVREQATVSLQSQGQGSYASWYPNHWMISRMVLYRYR